MRKNEYKTSEQRLIELGYKPQLKRTLTTSDNIILTMSSVSPLMAAFLLGLSPIRIAGTATFPGMLLFSIFVLCNGFVLAEMAGSYPVSGGLHSFIRLTLPPVFNKIAACSLLVQSVVVNASIALGISSYAVLLFPFLPGNPGFQLILSMGILIVFGLVCMRGLSSSTNFTKGLFVVQCAVLLIYVISCLFCIHRGPGEVLLHPVFWEDGIRDADFGILLAAVTPLFCVINGYDASVGLSEETMGESREISRSVIISVIGAVVSITAAVGASILAAPDLESYLTMESPFLYTAQAVLGDKGKIWLNAGILVASCGALLSQITYYSRVLFSTARDGVWPEQAGKYLRKISKKGQVPYVAVSMIVVCTILTAALAPLEKLVEFVGVLVAFIYMLIAIGSIKNRLIKKEEYRPFVMPLFPLPAVIVVVTASIIILIQPLLTKGILGLVILAGILLYKRRGPE